MKIGFIGLGKLGFPIAEAIGKRHPVAGFDVLPRRSDVVTITPDLPSAVRGQEIIFVALPTPHDPAYGGHQPLEGLPLKNFDYSSVARCFTELSEILEDDQTVVLISTVLPGTTRTVLKPALKKGQLVYNPYLIAMGSEVEDFLRPEMVILGTEDGSAASTAKLKQFYETLLPAGTVYAEGSWEEAESIKIFYNTFISAKLSIVNMVQDVAERLGNMNVDVVTTALAGATQRIISPAYMKAGMGDGGPCHPRDNIALRWLSRDLGLGYDLFEAIVKSREVQARNLANAALRLGSRVMILGRAYKPGVPYTDGSYSELVAYYINKAGGTAYFYDPKTGDTALPSDYADFCFLIGHWESWIAEFPFPQHCPILDPWRAERLPGRRHIHYGNTRDRAK